MTIGCRYDLGADHSRDKERYAAKEREEVILRARERKMAEMKVRYMHIKICSSKDIGYSMEGCPVLPSSAPKVFFLLLIIHFQSFPNGI